MIYKAVTIDAQGMITGVHESLSPIGVEAFLQSPIFAGCAVITIDENTEYSSGHKMAEYTAAGALKPLIDRITEGLVPVPEGYELVNGALVAVNVPATQAPASLQETLAQAQTRADAQQALIEAQAAKLTALTEQNTFYEGLIMEMAQLVYA